MFCQLKNKKRLREQHDMQQTDFGVVFLFSVTAFAVTR